MRESRYKKIECDYINKIFFFKGGKGGVASERFAIFLDVTVERYNIMTRISHRLVAELVQSSTHSCFNGSHLVAYKV